MPSSELSYPDCNWLIGNHSDELTPWIPAIASLAPNCTNFFVLPCCAFTFTGKFVKRKHQSSLYREYLDYVKNVGSKCGFVMEEDRLKIPSTKRVCFVGRARNHPPKEKQSVITTIMAMLPEEKASEPSEKKSKLESFVPRPAEIKVRNCTKVATEVREKIIGLVCKRLLSPCTV